MALSDYGRLLVLLHEAIAATWGAPPAVARGTAPLLLERWAAAVEALLLTPAANPNQHHAPAVPHLWLLAEVSPSQAELGLRLLAALLCLPPQALRPPSFSPPPSLSP